jgi:hypothetical protein
MPGRTAKSTFCDRWGYDQKHCQEARRAEDLEIKHRRPSKVEACGQKRAAHHVVDSRLAET